MRNIYNWLFGSFFKTLGRVIVYILLGYLLSFLLKDIDFSSILLTDVYASTDVTFTTNYDGPEDDSTFYNNNLTTLAGLGYIKFNRFQAYNCSSSSSCTSSFGNSIKSYSGGQVISGVSIANYGIDIAHTTEISMTPNHLYSYTQLVCYEASPSLNSVKLFVNSGVGSNRRNQIQPLYTNWYYVSSIKWDHWNSSGTSLDVSGGNCYTYYYLFNNNEDSNTIKTNIITSSFTNKKVNFVGYKLEDLGATDYVTESGLQNIINNSGLATASGVNEVKSSVQQVQSQLNDVNSSIEDQTEQQNQNHQETINTITDDSINDSGTTDFTNGLDREYSSLTPFSDFINLPLRWIQSLFSSQNSCQDINLPIPYLNNKTLTLPCMTEFWQRMGSLGTLIQVVWIAIVGVRIFNGLFLLTCETLDPNPDKDMTKLRTWEL